MGIFLQIMCTLDRALLHKTCIDSRTPDAYIETASQLPQIKTTLECRRPFPRKYGYPC